MGEMLDSLALDHVSQLTSRLVPLFSRFSQGCLMLLTKSANVDGLLSLTPNNQVVVSWSLNTQRTIQLCEVGTADLEERIDAARRCQKHGYRVRLRVDPGILCPDWRADYADLIRKALTAVEPENITLGMLRLVPGHFQLARHVYGNRGAQLQDMALITRASDGKQRYSPEQRVEFYQFLIDMIRSCNTQASIGLCRETPDIWARLRSHCDPAKCNCLIR